MRLSRSPRAKKSSLDTEYPAASSTDVARTEVDTVRSGLEFKGLRRAGRALIFGRGVKTLTFTLHSPASPLRLLKDREEAHIVCRGERYIGYVQLIYICTYVHACQLRAVHICMTTYRIYEDRRWKDRGQTIYSVYGPQLQLRLHQWDYTSPFIIPYECGLHG